MKGRLHHGGGGGDLPYSFQTEVWVLYDPFDFDQWKTDEDDKANSLT